MRAIIQQASKTSVQFEDEQISQNGQGLPVFSMHNIGKHALICKKNDVENREYAHI